VIQPPKAINNASFSQWVMAHAGAQRSYKLQESIQRTFGVEISKDDPTTIYELQERLGKVSFFALLLGLRG
jgi:hypothetical protein